MLATTLWTASGIIIYLLAPLASPALLLLAPVAPVAWQIATKSKLSLQKPSQVILTLALAGLYLALNASWSLSPSTAHFAIGMFLGFTIALYFVVNALAGCDADVLRAMALGLCVGAVIGAAVLCFDTISLQWPQRVLMSLVPILRAKPQDMALEGELVTFLQPFLLNRNITALMFIFWPALLAIVVLNPVPRRQRWWLFGLVPAAAAIFGSEHATSKIAFVGAVVTFGLFQLSPALARRAIASSWVAAVLFVLPAATLAYQNQLYLSPRLPHSAQHRIVIWGYTSPALCQCSCLGRWHQHCSCAQQPGEP